MKQEFQTSCYFLLHLDYILQQKVGMTWFHIHANLKRGRPIDMPWLWPVDTQYSHGCTLLCPCQCVGLGSEEVKHRRLWLLHLTSDAIGMQHGSRDMTFYYTLPSSTFSLSHCHLLSLGVALTSLEKSFDHRFMSLGLLYPPPTPLSPLPQTHHFPFYSFVLSHSTLD